MKPVWTALLGGLVLLGAPSADALSAPRRPNILYIMADDHSAAAIGAYATLLKGVVHTPNIDRLARQGALFSNVQCVNSLCAPSRATIITGLYSHQTGVYTLREELNTATLPTVPKLLQQSGYQTAVIGKWHVHGDNLHGFDYYAVTKAQGSYVNPSLSATGGKKLRFKGHVTDAYTEHSLQWLEQRDKKKPFFLMTHFKAAHGPWHYAPRYAELYQDTEIPEPPTLADDYAHRDPAGVPKTQSRIHRPDSKTSLSLWFSSNKKGKGGQWPTGTLDLEGMSAQEKLQASYQKYIKDYLRCVAGIDQNVGRLIDYLDQEGILDNTVVIYTSDQGMYLGEHGFFDKRLGLNPAMQMPLIMRYPRAIKAGVVFDQLVNNVDYAETLLEIADVTIPDSMQGFSFWGLATGTSAWNRTQSIYQFYSNGAPKHYGLVTADYKLLKYTGKDGTVMGVDLFDRRQDPRELVSLSSQTEHASLLADMEARLAKELVAIGLDDDHLPGKWQASGKRKSSGKKAKRL